jgi:hypothetical protein
MQDYRIGKRCQLHPALDAWMQGDRYGTIIAVSKKCWSYLDPRDLRNGHRFTVLLDKSGKRKRLREADILEVF